MKYLEKIKQNVYIPFILILLIFGIYDCMILPCYADDINLYTGILEKQSIWEFMEFRYRAWSSRIIIEAVLVYMVKYQIVWRILNTLVAVGIAWFMSKLVNDEHKYAWPVCFGVIMYPFIDMSTAGWIATMLNYWWPLFTLLVLAYYLKKVMQGKTLRIYEYIISIVFAIFTCNHEQAATVVLILFLGCGLYHVIKNKKMNGYIILILVIDLISYGYILACPGNSARLKQSGGDSYSNISLFKKLELGIFNVENRFFCETNLFLIVFVALLVYLVWKTRKESKCFWVCFPMLVVLGGYQILDRFMPVCKKVFVIADRTMEIEMFSVESIIKIAWFVVFVISMLVCFYQLLDKDINECLHVGIVLLAGFGSAEMLGMSPTVFTSDTRIFIFFYFSLIYALVMCFKHAYKKITFFRFEHIILDLMFLAVGAYQVLYVVSNIIGRRKWEAIPIDFEIGKVVIEKLTILM